jgi:hypothetical protein
VIAILLVWGAAGSSAAAHFVWLECTNEVEGARANVYFSEGPHPGESHLIDRIAHCQVWQKSTGGQERVLELVVQEMGEQAALTASCQNPHTTRLELVCDYGLFSRGDQTMLLAYFAKHLPPLGSDACRELARSDRLSLDIVPQRQDGSLLLTVYWQGSPAAAVEVTVVPMDGEAAQYTTDSLGEIRVPLPSGPCAVRARYAEPHRSGERDGRKFQGALTYSTLTFQCDDQVLSAGELLAQARASRAVWEDFPGFRAMALVRGHGASQRGTLTIAADGSVTLEGMSSHAADDAVEHLESLAMHRLSGDAGSEPVEFVEEVAEHPLGRLIRFAGDDAMLSTYRVSGDVITQVNRQPGATRFTINVLDVHRDREGKYLPRSFQVGTWDTTTGELLSSVTHLHTWCRVGSFELPSRIVVVRTTSEGNSTVEVQLSQHELLSAAP